MKEQKYIKQIITNAIVAALYAVITFATSSFSFMGIQFRIAELLLILCFFNKGYIIGITFGCLLANAFSPIMFADMIFGTLATLISCFFIAYSKHLLISLLFPIIINAFVVGAELYFVLQLPFWINVGYVALGELTVLLVGYILFMIIKNKNFFYKLIDATQNTNFKF